MPRQKKKHHARRLIRPAKAHRNKILNRDLDQAYNHYCGSTLSQVLRNLDALSEDSKKAKGYYLALKAEIANRRAKKHKGDMSQRLYREKSSFLNQLISHCQLAGYRIEKGNSHDLGGPSNVLYCYLPGCEQVSWHCHLGTLPIPIASTDWDGKKFSTLNKLEAGLMTEFYSYAPPA